MTVKLCENPFLNEMDFLFVFQPRRLFPTLYMEILVAMVHKRYLKDFEQWSGFIHREKSTETGAKFREFRGLKPLDPREKRTWK